MSCSGLRQSVAFRRNVYVSQWRANVKFKPVSGVQT